MKVMIAYPPLKGPGYPMLSQNRQFQFFSHPCYIYPMVPASAATLLHENDHKVVWVDGIAEGWSYKKFAQKFEKESPDLIMMETKTPVVKQHWKIIGDLKERSRETKFVLVGDHVTALPEESMKNCKVDYILMGGDYDFLLFELCNYLEGKGKMPKGVWYRKGKQIKNTGKFELDHDLNTLPFIDRDLTKWELYSRNVGNYKDLPGTYTIVGRDCLTPDTELILKIGHHFQIAKIGELTDKLMNEFETEFQGISEVVKIKDKQKIHVFGYDPITYKIKLFEVAEFIRKPAPHTMYEVITESGRRLKVTSTHPFFVLEEGSIIERFAKDLNVGDYGVVPITLPFNGVKNNTKLNLLESLKELPSGKYKNYKILGEEVSEILYARPLGFWIKTFDLKRYTRNRWDCRVGFWRRSGGIPFDRFVQSAPFKKVNKQKLSIITKGCKKPIPAIIPLNKEFARIIGYLLSDGCVSSSKIRCYFGLDEKDLVRDFCHCIKSIFKVKCSITIKKDKKGKDSWIEVLVPNSTLAHIFRDVFGFSSGRSEKKIPPILFTLTKESTLNFIASYLAGDGFGGKYAANIRSTSPQLINGLTYLLMKCKIPFQIRKCKKQKISHNDPYELTLTSNFARQISKIGFLGKKRQMQIDQIICESSGPFYSRFFPISNLGLLTSKEKLPLTVRSKIDYCKERTGKNTVLEVLKFNPNKKIKKLIDSDLRFDKIVKIVEFKTESKFVYDIHVPSVENFVSGFGGIITHNCWWHKCTFCSWPTLYPSYRTRSPQSLLDEIGILIEKYKVKEIMDDTGTFPVGNWLKEFCNGMIERGYNEKIRIDCNMRFGFLNQEDYNLMRKAGFRFVLYGLESANQNTLNRLDKGIKVQDIVDGCRMAKKAGLDPHITCMIGYPWETKQDAKKTIELSKHLFDKGWVDTLQATIVIPYPGSKLFEECKENNWLMTKDWNRYDMREPIMKTEMTAEEIKELTQGLYKIFTSPKYITRRVLSIRSTSDVKFLLRNVKALLGHLRDFSS